MRTTGGRLKNSGLARRHKGDLLIVLLTSVLMLLGLVVIYSISPALTARINAAGNTLDQNHFMYRQLAYLAVGIIAFVFASNVPLKIWEKHKGKLLIGSIAATLLPVILASTPLALCTNGACRWINLGFTTAQPAEAIKLALVVFAAGFLAQRIKDGRLNDLRETIAPLGAILGVIALIVVVLQKDLGTGLAIFGIIICMLFVAGLSKKNFLLVLGGIGSAGILLVISSAHRLDRMITFMNAGENTDGAGYHIHQALIAVGSGGLTGKGLGRSIQAFGYLPEAANDSIFAIVAEKFGFIGTVVILMIFVMLFFRLIKIMNNSLDVYQKLLVAGIFGWIFTHTIVNIGAMLGIFPLTGVTLPFLSFGGTSLLFIMMALGIVLQVSRYTTFQIINNGLSKGESHENRRRRRGLGRTRHASPSRN